MHFFQKFSNTVAIKMTAVVATMECVYVFTLWSLLPLLVPNLQSIVFYVSGGILQLILLPAILVGQNLLGKAAEARAVEDHNALMETVANIRQVIVDDKVEQGNLTEIIARLAAIETAIKSKL